MVFSGLTFLYWFLPPVLAVYFAAPNKWKNAVLLAASLVFYGWGEPKYLLLMAFTIVFFYGAGLALERVRGKKALLAAVITVGVLELGIFKYTGFFTENLSRILPIPVVQLALPMGISFYLFQCMSYTVDVYRGQVPAQKNLLNFACYVSLFPQLVAGPIVRYATVSEELTARTHSFSDFSEGITRFLLGLGKKVLLADTLAILAERSGSAEMTVLGSWLYAVAFTLEIYFDFSGYSDMAIGLGRMLGFHFCENFDYPYCSRSVTEFWRRWHMSLGSWFRDYVYIPLGGNRVSKSKWIRNMTIVWLLTGFWHGAGWNFILWGAFYGVLLIMEKSIPVFRKLPKAVGHLYVLLAVTVGFVIFDGDTLPLAAKTLTAMAGISSPLRDAYSVYLLTSFARVLVIGGIAATPLPALWAKKLPKSWKQPLLYVWCAVILLLSTACLVDGSFTPFLYFRF